MDSSKYTPKVPYGSSFTATRTAKSSPLAPVAKLCLENDAMEPVIFFYIVLLTGAMI